MLRLALLTAFVLCTLPAAADWTSTIARYDTGRTVAMARTTVGGSSFLAICERGKEPEFIFHTRTEWTDERAHRPAILLVRIVDMEPLSLTAHLKAFRPPASLQGHRVISATAQGDVLLRPIAKLGESNNTVSVTLVQDGRELASKTFAGIRNDRAIRHISPYCGSPNAN